MRSMARFAGTPEVPQRTEWQRQHLHESRHDAHALPAFPVVFALYPQVTQLDFTGPAEVFARLPGARLTLASVPAVCSRPKAGSPSQG